MLTVAKVTGNAAAGYADYLQGKAASTELGDYYLREGQRVEAPGRWIAGASRFGCDPVGAVTSEQLGALMSVRRPDTDQPLRRVGGDGSAVAAIDATFSAPKSVSAIWALSDPDGRELIEYAHEQAVDRAVSYAVDHVAMIRQRVDRDTVIHAKASSVVATSWRHTTSRAVDGQAPDPQLHSHVLLHAGVRRDGRIVAIDSRSWLVHRRELGAAYRSELARELHHLGYGIERGTGRGGRYFEIDGVPRDLLDRWSSRHRQVQTAIDARVRDQRADLEAQVADGGPEGREAGWRLRQLDEHGPQLSPRQDRSVTLQTRAGKNVLLTIHDLDHAWRAVGEQAGFDPAAVRDQTDGYRRSLDAADDRVLLAGLTEFEATFPARDARAVALEASAGVTAQTGLDRLTHLRRQRELIRLEDGSFTTRAHRQVETETVQLAQRLAEGKVDPLDQEALTDHKQAVDRRVGGSGMSFEQWSAFERACGDGQLTVIEGQAGTGKSTVLAGIAAAHDGDGRTVIVTSTAALAAQRLATEFQTAGVHADAYSTAALHAAVENGDNTLGRDTTVIHDEAALASTRELHQLLTEINHSAARVVLVGDPRQSQAVGAGGLWPHIEQAARDHDAHVELTQNLRARDPEDRDAQQQFREEHAHDALRNYDHRSRIRFGSDQRRVEDLALDAAHHDRATGRRTIVIAQTSNDRLDELNARAQAIRIEHHELGAEKIPITGRPYSLHVGDEIQIRRNLWHPDHGDLRNGTTARIADIDPDQDHLWLELGDHDRVGLDRPQIDRADLRLSYVQHPFPAQGHTSDTAHLIVAEHTTQEGSYVAITRARDETHIHAVEPDPVEGHDQIRLLADRMSRSEPGVPSIDTPLAWETAVATEQRHASRPESLLEPWGLLNITDTPDGPRPDPDVRYHRVDRHEDAIRPATPAAGSYLTRALGPQPQAGARDRAEWDRAAGAIDAYRARYAIPDTETSPLGPQPPAGRFQQRHDRNHIAGILTDTGWPLARENADSVQREPPEHARENPKPDRSVVWEP